MCAFCWLPGVSNSKCQGQVLKIVLETFCLRGESRWVPPTVSDEASPPWGVKTCLLQIQEQYAFLFQEDHMIQLFSFNFSFLYSTFVKHLVYVKLMIDAGGTKMDMTQSREVSCCLIGTRQIQVDELKYHITYPLVKLWTKGTTEEEPLLSDCCPQVKHDIM